MEERDVTPLKAGLKYGAILGACIAGINLIEHFSGLDPFLGSSDSYSWYGDAAIGVSCLVVIILALRYYRTHDEGFLTYGEGVSTALFTGIFAGIIIAIFTFIFLQFMAPDVLGSLEDDNDFVPSPFFFAMASFFGYLLLSFLLGLICAAFMRKGN